MISPIRFYTSFLTFPSFLYGLLLKMRPWEALGVPRGVLKGCAFPNKAGCLAKERFRDTELPAWWTQSGPVLTT